MGFCGEIINSSNDRTVQIYDGMDLSRAARLVGSHAETDSTQVRIPSGRRVVIFIWLSLAPGSEPASLAHKLEFEQTGVEQQVGRDVTVTHAVRIGPGPVVISAPLQGDWYAWSGPGSPTGHRRVLTTHGGKTSIPQRFATDWLRVVDGRYRRATTTGDNSSIFGWGEEALAVGDGTVVAAKDGIPDNAPGARAVEMSTSTLYGNYVILEISDERYALYAHLQQGSLRVSEGDGQLSRRDVVGALAIRTQAPSRSQSQTAFPARNLTHVNVRVRDVKESERFYRDLFGLPSAREVVGAAFALDVPAGGFISLCPVSNPECGMGDPPTPGDIDHFGLGVENFRERITAEQLRSRGLEVVDGGSSVFVKDPNGVWVHLSAPTETFNK